MGKLRVIFMLKNSKGGDWQIQAFCPHGVIEHILGFKTDEEAWDWISGPQSKEWSSARGYSAT
jgi:hypothetical protein